MASRRRSEFRHLTKPGSSDTASLSSLAGRNAIFLLAATWMESPAAGLLTRQAAAAFLVAGVPVFGWRHTILGKGRST